MYDRDSAEQNVDWMGQTRGQWAHADSKLCGHDHFISLLDQ